MFQIPNPLNEDALGKMMERDEYWDDNHPDYKPLRDTVQAGYKKLYGGQQKVPLADEPDRPNATQQTSRETQAESLGKAGLGTPTGERDPRDASGMNTDDWTRLKKQQQRALEKFREQFSEQNEKPTPKRGPGSKAPRSPAAGQTGPSAQDLFTLLTKWANELNSEEQYKGPFFGGNR